MDQMKRAVTSIVVLLLVWSPHACAPPGTRLLSLRGRAMGCDWTLRWRAGHRDGSDPMRLQCEISETLEHWEQVLSTWRPNSDLMCYNRGAQASSDLQRVLALAEQMKQQSGGAFDAHILAQLQDQGFGPPHCGDVGRGVDLSSLGKGFAVDRIAEILRQQGINDFLFCLAGEMIAGDGAWRVAIDVPEPGPVRVLKEIDIHREALATSGNYRQCSVSSTGVICHIIDPRCGVSVQREPSSVSVRGSSAALASAWATSLFVLGPSATCPEGFTAEWHWGRTWQELMEAVKGADTGIAPRGD